MVFPYFTLYCCWLNCVLLESYSDIEILLPFVYHSVSIGNVHISLSRCPRHKSLTLTANMSSYLARTY
ncbi:hypothetical protein VNO77_40670 [Canavalia gladiata]|uniref:Uncharacterized protein n=1 Tax=Canavalia gladiata TaxID=3824 RepID=A0AAN9JXU3_CANGL